MYQEYQNRKRPPETVAKSAKIFWNTAVMCGTAIVVAITVKIIMTIFI